jgi:DNA polymerase
MTTLSIDLETYSDIDIKACGGYAYVNSPAFEILLCAYAFDDDPVTVVDFTEFEDLPAEVAQAIHRETLKTAFNAQFERTCFAKHYNTPMPPLQWDCTMVRALTLGLPGSLGEVSRTLKLSEDKAKMGIGKSLINYFCKPCKPTEKNGMRTRNMPWHDPEKWQQFKEYNQRDVETERTIRKMMLRFEPLEEERRIWALDQKINDRGIKVDLPLIANAIRCDAQYQAKRIEEAVRLTGLANPKSVAQLKKWLTEAEGVEITKLNKESIPVLLKQTESETVKRVLELRQETSKTSVTKYEAMDRAVCDDQRVRGLLQFYGANRTGRWASRLVQVQNLPKNIMLLLDYARQLVRDGDFEFLEMFFDGVSYTLSQLIRTAFIPETGYRFIVADFSAIEARVIAWLANEKWRLDVFNGHGKIYEASAAQMFHVPFESIDKHSPLRQKGKVSELALGYQGGSGALIRMGALEMGLTEKELPSLVRIWRKANPNIVQLWYDVENAALAAVKDKKTVHFRKNMVFSFENGIMFIKLPSGRRLAYVRPRIEEDERFGSLKLTYEGVNQETKKWERTSTYGGKLVENITQAISRDCLRDAMLRLDDVGYDIVMHVHDEAVIEAPYGFGSVEHACEVMGQPLSWAPGLPLRADGYETEYYKKDD